MKTKHQANSDNIAETFNRIAPGWYNFRHWTIFKAELEELARRWQKGGLLNLGCGHGPDFLPFKQAFELYGVDCSSEMLKMAERYAAKHGFKAELTLADVRRLPYPDASFNWAIAVATYHHIHCHTQQLKAFCELKRVLKPGGEAFITVWNRWQPRFWLKPREVLLPWKAEGQKIDRYYHLFTYGEIKRLAQKAGFKVLKVFPESRYHFPLKYFSRNICLLIKKYN